MIWPVVRAFRKKISRCLLDACRLLENICDQLLEGAKELCVVKTFRLFRPHQLSLPNAPSDGRLRHKPVFRACL